MTSSPDPSGPGGSLSSPTPPASRPTTSTVRSGSPESTPQPNAASGTNSQQFNGIPYADINTTTPLVLVGHRRDDRYRTNVGFDFYNLFNASTLEPQQ